MSKILVIDDDPAIADVMQQFFRMTGYQCHTMESGVNIQTLIAEFQPDLIIMDYLLPVVNGGELCSAIKADAQTKDIPVLICTAYPKVLLSLGTYGSDAFMAKPFDLDDLMQTVEQLLGSHAIC